MSASNTTPEPAKDNSLTDDDKNTIADEVARYATAHKQVKAAVSLKAVQLKEDQTEARELTARRVAETREEEKQAILSDESVAHGLAKLRLEEANALAHLVEQPYFARVITKEGARTIEFRLGLASFPDQRIIDWRKGPISRLYYDYNEGEEFDEEIQGQERHGVIALKRGFRGQEGELSGIEMKDRSYVRSRGQWHHQKKNQGAEFSLKDREKIREFLKNADTASYSRLEGDSGYLPQILSLLTPEQFALISNDTESPLVIQGAAGTGKTTVALHRLAWLLFEGREGPKAKETLIIVYNHALAQYIKFVLPSLGINDVRIATFQEWQADQKRQPQDRKFPSRLGRLLVDETQDFSIEQIRIMIDALDDTRHLILAGDLGQKIIEGSDLKTWPEMLDKIGVAGASVINLNTAYRSTYQIYELAEFIRDPSVAHDDLKMMPRFGPEPLLTICNSEADALRVAKEWIEDVQLLSRESTGAILCRSALTARDLYQGLSRQGCHGIRQGSSAHMDFTPGITIAAVSDVKGLEFRNVLLFGVSEKYYPLHDKLSRNLLYVGVTRAEARLDLVCDEAPSAILPEFLERRDLTQLADVENAVDENNNDSKESEGEDSWSEDFQDDEEGDEID